MQHILKAALLCSLLIGCQTVQNGSSGGDNYNIFFSQADHVKALLAKGKIQEASDVYSEYTSFFLGKGKTHTDLLAKLRTGTETLVGQSLSPLASQIAAQSWPAPQAEWKELGALLSRSDAEIDRAKRNKILTHASRSPSIHRAVVAFDDLTRKITASVDDEFDQYDIFNSPNFGEVYPVKVELTALLDDNADRLLKELSDSNIAVVSGFKATYKTDLPETMNIPVAKIFFDHSYAALRAQNKTKIGALIKAITQSNEAGFEVKTLDSARIKAVDITSKALMNARQIEFPIELERDLPIEVVATDLDNAVLENAELETEILVLIDVAAAKVDRDIDAYEPVSSEHQIGTQSYPNPGYANAQNAVTQAQMNLQGAQLRQMTAGKGPCTGFGCILHIAAAAVAIAAVAEAEEEMNGAMSTMQTTPMMLERPVYKSYDFRKASIDASKLAVVNYYIIDKNEGRYVKGTFDAKETQSFTVPYGMKLEDRHKDRHLAALDTEAEVKAFEEKSFGISLTSIIEEYTATEVSMTKLKSLRALRTQILEDKNIAIARFQADRIRAAEDTTYADLARSVVVVYNPQGGLGTGFYVNDDLILTNFHVIEGTTFVEMKLKDGTETFGKVIAKDVRLDLALIRTQHRGKPVKFHHGNDIGIGATAIAIGHPRGLEFTTTRGIVSAIRAHKNVIFGHGKEVYFVQTDTPINQGNSGGPLFLDGSIIGVNDWVVSKQIAEGLNFAIHVKEVLRFLRKENVQVNIAGETS